jgi:hypothetical protein
MNRRALFARLAAVAAVVSLVGKGKTAEAHVEHSAANVTMRRGVPIPGPAPYSVATSGHDYSALDRAARGQVEQGPLSSDVRASNRAKNEAITRLMAKRTYCSMEDGEPPTDTELQRFMAQHAEYKPWITMPSLLEPKE